MEWFGPAFSWALSKMSTRVSARPLRCQRRENRHRAAEARRPRITTCSQLLAVKHPFLLKSAERLLAQFSSRAPALSSRATHAAGVVAAEYSAVVAVLAPMRGHLTRDERAPLLPSSRQQPFSPTPAAHTFARVANGATVGVQQRSPLLSGADVGNHRGSRIGRRSSSSSSSSRRSVLHRAQ